MGNLIKCPMCDKDISPNAISCPHCGEPMKIQPQEIKKSEPTSYNLVLVSCSQKIKTIKLIRECTHLGLKEAKEITDFMPTTFMLNVDINRANQIKNDFDVLGAKVNLVDGNNIIETKSNYIAQDNLIKCPNCKSVNCNKISGISKATSAGIWGMFSIGKLVKTWECKSCGYKW